MKKNSFKLHVILGNEEILDILIKNGAESNLRGFEGNTALHFGALKGNRNIQKQRNNHKEFFSGYEDILEMLIQNGANINSVNDYGETALLEAVRKNHSKVVDQLISKGADVNIADKTGLTALQYASIYGN